MDYRDYIPSSIRMYGKQFLSPSNITEKDFTNKEIEALRRAVQASMRREDDTNNYYLDKARRGEYIVDDAGWATPAREMQEAFMRQRGTLGYEDYATPKGRTDSWEQNILRSLGDVYSSQDFNMKNTLGRAKYNRDNNGNIVVRDVYDFDNMKVGGPVYSGLHKVASQFGTPMGVSVNLGNPNDWR